MGKRCVEVHPDSKTSTISEVLCIGCGVCARECPFNAIQIINLPKSLTSGTSHRYGPNAFKLHGLPIPKKGTIVGLVGINGIGKSTILKILAGNLTANLGHFDAPPSKEEIVHYYRGSELQSYFSQLYKGEVITSIKPQYVDAIPKRVKGKIGRILQKIASKGRFHALESVITALQLETLSDRRPKDLSGGELQRFATAAAILKEADMYIFDEPCSFLDIYHRLRSAQLIRSLLGEGKYVLVVEHDLSILDYLSDSISIVHGQAGGYGVVSMPFGAGEGINHFLEGYIPTENIRFRNVPIHFASAKEEDQRMTEEEEETSSEVVLEYENILEVLSEDRSSNTFTLHIDPGSVTTSQITLLLGKNGLGKTTFVRKLIAETKERSLRVSYKPQQLNPTFKGTVKQLLSKRIKKRLYASWFVSLVLKPLKIPEIENLQVRNLSGGELQRMALALALGVPAEIYLLDEPSSYLDVEMRNIAVRVIKRFVMTYKKTAFVVEHDLMMGAYLADQIVLFTGTPGLEAVAHSPQPLHSGMNAFLEDVNVTLRRDTSTGRPRINKSGSVKDQEQKRTGLYFFEE
uniref:Translation initiation factor n=1 Tax=Pithovirus LCPAC304 TaxID=2506594 RepID=A0A481ZAE7_9VIRU|nr:MAG: translation initiation factor [Pithovirus LCPAC304]